MVGGMRRYQLEPELEKWATAVIGAAIEVHRVLGPGYLEAIYEAALCLELASRQIPFQQQFRLTVVYKGNTIGEGIIDILVAGMLVVELKAVNELAPIHEAQIISYLKATGFKLGLLINFNVPLLKEGGIRRFVHPSVLKS